jgi:hypothetical protein
MTVVSFEVGSCPGSPEEQLLKVPDAESRAAGGGSGSVDSAAGIEDRMWQLQEKLEKMSRQELRSEAKKNSVNAKQEGTKIISKLISIERGRAWLELINAVRCKTAPVNLSASSSLAPIIHGPVSKSDTGSFTGDVVEKSRLVLQVLQGTENIFIIIEENTSTGPTNLHQIHRIADSISGCDLGFRPDLFAIFTSDQVPETILDSMKTRPPGVVIPPPKVRARELEIMKKGGGKKRQEEEMMARKENICGGIVNLGNTCVHFYLGCLIVGYCVVIVYIAEACVAPQRLCC